MKKSQILFWMTAIFAVVLFTACSSDDDDDPIVLKADTTLVEFDAEGGSKTVTITPADAKDLKETGKPDWITITWEGNVATLTAGVAEAERKATITFTAYNAQSEEVEVVQKAPEPEPVINYSALEDTYEGDGLNLEYSGAALLGGQASYKHGNTEEAKGTITLSGVIPGEEEVELAVELTPVAGSDNKQFTFKDENETTTRKISYEGSIEEGKMTLELTVEMASSPIMKTWNFQSVHAIWESALGVETSMTAMLIKMNLTPKLADLLESVTFLEDGNIVASYAELGDEDDDIPQNPDFVTSPINLAHYYVKDNQIHVVLRVENIIAYEEAKKTRSEIDLEAILAGLILKVKEGIPVNYAIEGNALNVFVDKDFITALWENELVQLGIELLKTLLDEEDPMQEMVLRIFDLFDVALPVTTQMELGLTMEAA